MKPSQACWFLFFGACLRAQPAARPTQTSPAAVPLSIVEAGQMTIDLNPQLGIQKEQINYNRGALLIQQSVFDLNLTGSVLGSHAYTYAEGSTDLIPTNTATTDLGTSQLLRSGITVAPSIQLNRVSDNVFQTAGFNQPQVAVQVTLPLMRNHGRAAVTAKETAANLEVDASVYDLNQLASQALAYTATAYWNYVGAIKSLEVYGQSEQRAREFLESVQALAAADIYPRIQIQDAVANLAARTASRIGQEQAVVQARQQLALAVGVDDRHVLSVGAPSDPLPDGTGQPTVPLDPEHLQQSIALALKRRADYLGSKVRSNEQHALLVGSKNLLRPQLDVVGNLGYTGLRTGFAPGDYLAPLFLSPSGPNVSVGVQYQFPLQNRLARGELVQNEAALRQQDWHSADLARQIASSVVASATALNFNALQLGQARQASAAALAGLNGERERLRQGVGSVLDTLQTEDRYIAAILNEIAAQVSYATAIENFRFATGTYLDPDRPVQSVGREAFYSPVTP